MYEEGRPNHGRLYQRIAIVLCMVLATLMVLNTQMSGEAMWFWYGSVFGQGAKLYSELHIALQPLFVLETSTWLKLFGNKIGIDEIPSLIHAFLLVIGLSLVVKESPWPDWQKGILLLSSFVLVVAGHSYRFDDYHVLAEAFITYALVSLLWLGRVDDSPSSRKHNALLVALGIICGLTIVTRVTDGAALITACILILPCLLTRGRATALLIVGASAAITVFVVVHATGDTFSAYLSSSLFRAAGSKGGTGSIFSAPLLAVRNTVLAIRSEKKAIFALCMMFGAAAYLSRKWPDKVRYIIPIDFAIAGLFVLINGQNRRTDLIRGQFFEDIVLFSILGMYIVALYLLYRYRQYRHARGSWDRRYVLLLLPILEWASYSAGAAAEPLTNYYAPIALLLLLIPIFQPFRRQARWAYPAFLGIMALVAVNGIEAKVAIPYSWQNYKYAPMFRNRELYRHPTHGEMYIDKDLLTFSERVCRDIGSEPGTNRPQLLSLPYPYPNYFCDTPPWHNYVQTFFDTATRATVEQMMRELQSDPPQWIVYQRQLNIMNGAERLYNHGRPIAQRDLDRMIMGKLASGEWKLVDRSSYLRPNWYNKPSETDWYIIQTHP